MGDERPVSAVLETDFCSQLPKFILSMASSKFSWHFSVKQTNMFYLTMQHFKYSSNSVLAEYTQLALFRDEKGRQKKKPKILYFRSI